MGIAALRGAGNRAIRCPFACLVDGLLQGGSQMLDKWFNQHHCRINGQNDNFLSTLGKAIPFQVRLVEYAVLCRRTKVCNDTGI